MTCQLGNRLTCESSRGTVCLGEVYLEDLFLKSRCLCSREHQNIDCKPPLWEWYLRSFRCRQQYGTATTSSQRFERGESSMDRQRLRPEADANGLRKQVHRWHSSSDSGWDIAGSAGLALLVEIPVSLASTSAEAASPGSLWKWTAAALAHH